MANGNEKIINEKQNEEKELKEVLAEVEDFVKKPSKYHKENINFKEPFTEEEKKKFIDKYKNSVDNYNKFLSDDKKIKLDVENLQKRLNDPKEIETYRRLKYIKEKQIIQLDLYQQYKKEHNLNDIGYPLTRDISRLMRVDDSKESKDFNKKLLDVYSKHPYEVAIAVLRGEYSSDSSVFDGILMDDYDRAKVYYDNFENIALSWNEAFAVTELIKDGNIVDVLKDGTISDMLQEKEHIASGFENPEDRFEFPKMTHEQIEECLTKNMPPHYILKTSEFARNELIEESRKNIKALKAKGILDDKEPMLSYKAIEIKNGIEKPIGLVKALSSNNQNVKIIKRDEKEKKIIRYITNGNFKRHIEETKKHMDVFKKDFLNSYSLKNTAVKINTFDKNIILNQHKGGIFERMFNTTSKEYKDFVEAFNEFTNEKSPDFGDKQILLDKAKAYIKHKNVTDELSVERLDKTGRERVKLCQSIIEAIEKNQEINHVEIEKNIASNDKEPALNFDDVNIEKAPKPIDNNKIEKNTVKIDKDISK